MNLHLLARSAWGLLWLSCLLLPTGLHAQPRRVPMFACTPPVEGDAATTFQDRPCTGRDAGLRWITPEPLHAGEPPPSRSTSGRQTRRHARRAVQGDVTPSGPIALTRHRHGQRPFGLQDPPAKKPRSGRRDPNRRIAKAPRLERPTPAGVNAPTAPGERSRP